MSIVFLCNGLVQRGVDDTVVDKLAAKYNIKSIEDLIGKVYTDNGYMSTSAMIGNPIVTMKQVVLDIIEPKGKSNGAYINDLSLHNDTEYEFLTKRGAGYTITDAKYDREMKKYILKMVRNSDKH